MDESISFLAPSPAPLLHNVSVPYSELLAHPERYFSSADIVWVMISAALVFLMVPSLSLIYAGMGGRTFALTLFRLPLITCAFIGFQWVLWGYALAFTRSNLSPSWWGGEIRAFALADVVARPVFTGDETNGPAIPELVYILFEGMFASFTAALVCGGTMHKVRPARFLVFITLWSLFVYIPVARWSWDRDGWSNKLGTMDFAGGTPVHIVSGVTVAAFAVFSAVEARARKGELAAALQWQAKTLIRTFLWTPYYGVKDLVLLVCGVKPDQHVRLNQTGGPRQRFQPEYEPYNVNYLALGTAILWFGWAGFNGGSALAGNLRAVSAWTATHIAACSGGTIGVVLMWLQKYDTRDLKPKPGKEKEHLFRNQTVFYFCDGAIAGLVAITPGAGYVRSKGLSEPMPQPMPCICASAADM